MLMNVGWKSGNHQQHGVAENVFPHDLLLADALGAGSHDVLLTDFIEKGVFG